MSSFFAQVQSSAHPARLRKGSRPPAWLPKSPFKAYTAAFNETAVRSRLGRGISRHSLQSPSSSSSRAFVALVGRADVNRDFLPVRRTVEMNIVAAEHLEHAAGVHFIGGAVRKLGIVVLTR